MNRWVLSQGETEDLRKAHDAPGPDATVFRQNELVAMVYCDDDGLWHMLVAVAQMRRLPLLEDVLQAKAALLPNIADFIIEPARSGDGVHDWLPKVPLFHLAEIRNPDVMEKLQ